MKKDIFRVVFMVALLVGFALGSSVAYAEKKWGNPSRWLEGEEKDWDEDDRASDIAQKAQKQEKTVEQQKKATENEAQKRRRMARKEAQKKQREDERRSRKARRPFGI